VQFQPFCTLRLLNRDEGKKQKKEDEEGEEDQIHEKTVVRNIDGKIPDVTWCQQNCDRGNTTHL
jgi:hypothetical protein